MDMKINVFVLHFCICLSCFGFLGCEDFLEVSTPKSKIERSEAFSNDVTSAATVLGIYSEFLNAQHFASGGAFSVSTLCGLSSDELVNNTKFDGYLVEFEHNDLTSINPYISQLWTSAYKSIYQANTVIEGLSSSKSISDSVKSQLMGGALFVRAFCNFYLLNLFSDVPLILTTDYTSNSSVGRTDVASVYLQVERDLLDARRMLSSSYVAFGGERIRPNRYAASALLARVYLFTGNWVSAEETSSEVIDQVQVYSLLDNPGDIFMMNSSETIWSLRPISNNGNGYTNEASIYSPMNVAYYNVLNEKVLASFEENDQRGVEWIDTLFVDADTIYYPHKYKQDKYDLPITEYSIVLRLAEQYLIRAEARVRLGKLLGEHGAVSDINIIRNRAGLGDTESLLEQDILNDIERERRIEFISEWGHRWFDLKRTGRVVTLKGNKPGFVDSDGLYPLPASEYTKNPNLIRQNPGY